MDVYASCYQCSSDTLLEGLLRAQTYTQPCTACHSKMSVFFLNPKLMATGGSVQLLDAQSRLGTINKAAAKRKKGPKAMKGFTVGEPLPDKGSCKHYRQSYKWLRFPCCGKAFACDECHDAESDHPIKVGWRISMRC